MSGFPNLPAEPGAGEAAGEPEPGRTSEPAPSLAPAESSEAWPSAEPGRSAGPGPTAEPDVVEQLAAALRADTADLDSYHRVLSVTVGDLLPPGMVEVDRDRSMSDRVAGRPGTATAIRVHLGDRTLELTAKRGKLGATVAQEVRGVIISRKEVSVADWTAQLAGYLAALAAESAEARAALSRLLGAG